MGMMTSSYERLPQQSSETNLSLAANHSPVIKPSSIIIPQPQL